MLASNHPNSFLDGVIYATLFDQPVYSLARGDVFKKKWICRLLAAVKLLPVYRTSEGVQNLGANYETFTECKNIFRRQGIVIIFSEGKCINEWHLRPLKKGTARLAISSWEENIPLRVLPVGINYSSFRRFGKNLFINFGEVIDASSIDRAGSDGERHKAFNALLEQQLHSLVFEIEQTGLLRQQKMLALQPPLWKKLLLFLPAIAGWLLHAPLYWPVQKFTYKKTNHNDHFDSVLIALLFFLYPVYVLLISCLLFYFTGNAFSFFCILLLPLTAWAYVQLKPQLDKPGA